MKRAVGSLSDQQRSAIDVTRRLLDNPISLRLADGWYPSTRDVETGDVRHDRHVLIWVRQYEAMLRELVDALDPPEPT